MTLLSNFDVASALIGASITLVLMLTILWPWIERQQQADARCAPNGRVPLWVLTDSLPPAVAAPAAVKAFAAPAEKYALVIRREDAPVEVRVATQPCIVPIPKEWAPPVLMADRAICETDETTLQLIPYVVVKDRAGRLLTYRRAKGGGEARLHEQRSVGFGGHVDSAPNVNAHFSGPALMYHLRQEASRELYEELGLWAKTYELRAHGLLVDPVRPEGRVHLGVLMTWEVSGEVELTLEEGVIDAPRWMALDELDVAEHRELLEPWSKVAVHYMRFMDAKEKLL